MAESKHTPGPWHVEGMYVFPGGYLSNPICGVSRYLGQPQGQISANASLIAAAPDLLAALKDAMRSARKDFSPGHEGDEQHRAAYAEQFAAIAKAGG